MSGPEIGLSRTPSRHRAMKATADVQCGKTARVEHIGSARDRRARRVRKGHPGTWDGVSTFREERNGEVRATEPAGRREVGARNSSDDVGELAPEDPAEQRSAPEEQIVRGRR